MAVSHLRNTPITGKSYTTSVDATHAELAFYDAVTQNGGQPNGEIS